MDKIYIGDIPTDFHYAVWGNNYVDLYKNSTLLGNQERYRIYFYDNTFLYSHGFSNFSTVNSTIAEDVVVSNEYYYRRDYPYCLFASFIMCIIFVLLFNMVSSVFKKGGLFSGLF